jgi:hypothetical protein
LVSVRLRWYACEQPGAYRLARLAVKYGAENLLDDLLVRLSSDLPLARSAARHLRRKLFRPAAAPRGRHVGAAFVCSPAGRGEGCFSGTQRLVSRFSTDVHFPLSSRATHTNVVPARRAVPLGHSPHPVKARSPAKAISAILIKLRPYGGIVSPQRTSRQS